MKLLLMVGMLVLCIPVYAPEIPYESEVWVKMTARVTNYSPLQRGEMKINHKGRNIRNERGVAVAKNTLPDGTQVLIPNIGSRIVDDRIPKRSVKKLMKRYPHVDIVIDARWYVSLNRNKSIIKQLYKRDKGIVDVWVRVR